MPNTKKRTMIGSKNFQKRGLTRTTSSISNIAAKKKTVSDAKNNSQSNYSF